MVCLVLLAVLKTQCTSFQSDKGIHMADSSKGKSRAWQIGIALVAVAAILWGGWLWSGSAKVVGDTPEQRIASICKLADKQARGAANAIAVAAADDPDPMVRRAALFTLERFVAPKYRPVVESALTDDDERVRAAAAATLGSFDDDAAADRLQELGAKDPSAAVRLAVVDGLEKNTAYKAIVHLVRAMENSKDQNVRLRALHALARRCGLPRRSVMPDDPKWWRNDVELVKEQPEVLLAFRITRTRLKHKVGDVVDDTDRDRRPAMKQSPDKTD